MCFQCYTSNSNYCPIDFFEECIKEEEYEAQKLDILRDAVRAKFSYSQQSDQLSVSDSGPTSATRPAKQMSPILEQNGHEADTNASSELSTEQVSPILEQNSNEVHANASSEQPTEQVSPILEQNSDEVHANASSEQPTEQVSPIVEKNGHEIQANGSDAANSAN